MSKINAKNTKPGTNKKSSFKMHDKCEESLYLQNILFVEENQQFKFLF